MEQYIEKRKELETVFNFIDKMNNLLSESTYFEIKKVLNNAKTMHLKNKIYYIYDNLQLKKNYFINKLSKIENEKKELFDLKSRVLNFGKYKGKTYEYVMEKDHEYLLWFSFRLPEKENDLTTDFYYAYLEFLNDKNKLDSTNEEIEELEKVHGIPKLKYDL